MDIPLAWPTVEVPSGQPQRQQCKLLLTMGRVVRRSADVAALGDVQRGQLQYKPAGSMDKGVADYAKLLSPPVSPDLQHGRNVAHPSRERSRTASSQADSGAQQSCEPIKYQQPDYTSFWLKLQLLYRSSQKLSS